jgi:hypothetical protein
MASQRPTFAKQQRERDRKMKAGEKRERRQNKAANGEEGDETQTETLSAEEQEAQVASVLRAIDALHKKFDDEQISFDEFEEKKAELFAKLPID